MGYVVTLLTIICIYTMLTASMDLILGYAGMFSFVHAALCGVGAYGAAYVMLKLGWGLVPATLAALAVTALVAQTTSFVGLTSLSLERSGNALIMLIIGGVGRLYGAFIGAPLFMIAQDRFSEIDPVYWYFWLGLLMVAVVVFARGGVLGLAERLWR